MSKCYYSRAICILSLVFAVFGCEESDQEIFDQSTEQQDVDDQEALFGGFGSTCPNDFSIFPLYEKGVLSLDFNPAFLNVDSYTVDGVTSEGLTISSFMNAYVIPGGMPPLGFFERDLVARIRDLDKLSFDDFDAANDVEKLTDTAFPPTGPPKTVWPNEAVVAPEGVFPFEALVIPQGFLATPFPGRLTAVNLDDPNLEEFIIHESTMDPTAPKHTPANAPRFYHRVLFIDMDNDGLEDIVTVRSGFQMDMSANPPVPYPPFSELVYFKNPGELIDATTPWPETVLYGGPSVGFMGPDISLTAHDFEDDDIPEIVATHYFSGGDTTGQTGKIVIYGAPIGKTWDEVNLFVPPLMPRIKEINGDQGLPFDVTMVDLNNDGLEDILATNHQPDNCSPITNNPVDGRVYALEQPADGNIFESEWTLRLLMDGIRPQPTPRPIRPPGRLAPGHAKPFYPVRLLESWTKPSLVVSGDEAGKVWILEPVDPWDPSNWEYESAVIFDINDKYDPDSNPDTATTQTPLADPLGITISTIGSPAIRYDSPGAGGRAEIYIPVFEAKEIHVFTYRQKWFRQPVSCSADATFSCE